MAERVTATERVQVSSRAESEIMRFARPDPETGVRPHALWHKHVHNVTLDAMQCLKMQEMDDNPNTVDVSCRRTGKTTVKELYALEFLATNPQQEEGIVAPRLQQSQIGLNYHLEAIKRSDMLSGYLAYKNGRKQQTDTRYQFYNGSKATAFGIMSQIDGDAITFASIDEVDDMPHDRLLSRFLPMLGAARRLGADESVEFKPQIRVTGVYKGADVLQTMLASGQYILLPTVDVYLAVEMGLVNEAWAMDMRAQQSEGEWIRQFLCRPVAAQNWIWEKYIRKSMAVGLAAGLQIADPLPGMRYKRRGLLTFGYDHTGHGESLTASKSSLVVCELIGNFVTFPFVKFWEPGTDDKIIENDLLGLWEYFRPDYAYGDAYGVGMLTSLNDRLFKLGLTDIDRMTVGDGSSNASSWGGWAFAPIRFEGMTKHSMASALRTAFHNGNAAIPNFDEDDPTCSHWLSFIRQLGNMKSLPTKASYSSFKMAEPKIGDDGFDAACAAIWALITRGQDATPAVISTTSVTREQLLGNQNIGSYLMRSMTWLHRFMGNMVESEGGILLPG